MMIEIRKGIWVQSDQITAMRLEDGAPAIFVRGVGAPFWCEQERAAEVLAYLRHCDALKIAAMPEPERPEIVAEL